MPLLNDEQVRQGLATLQDWVRDGDAIRKTYSFKSFRSAIDFVDRVADLAEAADHHPDIDVRYRKVTLILSTHSAGGITHRDIALAKRADDVVAAVSSQ